MAEKTITILVTPTEYELIRNGLGTVVSDYETRNPSPWARDSKALLERLPPLQAIPRVTRRFTKDEIIAAARDATIPHWVDERGLTPVETALQSVYDSGDWDNTNCERGR